MNILQDFINGVGDIMGTSKLARLNSAVFRPTLGTGITRGEYDMCNGQDLFEEPNKADKAVFKDQGKRERQQSANALLNLMVENGTVFKEGRITQFVASLQSTPGSNPVGNSVMRQMGQPGRERLKKNLQMQALFR